MSLFEVIIWSPDPAIFTIPLSGIGLSDRPIVWYGLLFAMGFILGQQVMTWFFKKEGRPVEDIDTLTTHMVLATIIGARLGHVLFYNPVYYLSNPIEIIKVWEGGLASHGGAIGILIAIWLYTHYLIKVKWVFVIPVSFSMKRQDRKDQSFLWVVDRLAIVVLLTGALIRTGNFINSEMEGKPTGSNLGVVYARGTEEVLSYDKNRVTKVTFTSLDDRPPVAPGQYPLKATIEYALGVAVDAREEQFLETRVNRTLKTYSEVVQHINFGSLDQPLDYTVYKKAGRYMVDIYGVGTTRHTAQLYEAGSCIFIMLILIFIWKNYRTKIPTGFSFALFMMMLWSLRFVDEFFKMNQEAFEDELPLNMGQWLSIPMFLVGLGVMIYAYKNQKRN